MHKTQSMWHNAFVAFFVVNAIFWALFPHSVHCNMLSELGVSKCPSHVVHVFMGIICFLIAVWIEQGNFFDKKTWD